MVNVGPLPGQDLRLHAPARDVGDFHDRPQILGEMLNHGPELFALEKAFADVVLLERRDVRAPEELFCGQGQGIHPLQGRQLPVDFFLVTRLTPTAADFQRRIASSSSSSSSETPSAMAMAS